MKINHIVCAALIACALSTAAGAQAATSAMSDSLNKQLQRGVKPAKSGNATALKPTAAAAQSSGGTTVKPARVVPVPAITTQSTSAGAKSAGAAFATDSASKVAPAVVRSARVAKAKPPTW